MSAAVVHLPRKAGRAPIQDGRRFLDLFPTGMRKSVRGSWVYAVGLRDGRIKIGVTNVPRGRLQSYWRQHEGLAWAHLFARVQGNAAALKVERTALGLLAVVGHRIGRSEYFRDLDRDDTLRVVRQAYRMHEAKAA